MVSFIPSGIGLGWGPIVHLIINGSEIFIILNFRKFNKFNIYIIISIQFDRIVTYVIRHLSITFVPMDVLTPEQRTKNMKAIRSKNTKMELLLAKSLWSKGIRYRKNDKSVFGRPDLTIKKYKIAIFVDSEYFHGKDWETEKYRIRTNQEFWWNKIESNQKRDQIVNCFLVDKGWKVLRFWSRKVSKNLNLCVNQIIAVIEEQKHV